jgi:tetratricopeptide (TPR) repeat protein/glycosyltransferase involved in cell wall biosynthesis
MPKSKARRTSPERKRPHPKRLLVWEGGVFSHHSLAHVNREVLLRLIDSGWEIRVALSEDRPFDPATSPRLAPLARRLKPYRPGKDPTPSVYVRHRWPPDFGRPETDRFVVMQPWEFGSLPVEWVRQIARGVDECWVYSTYQHDVYTRSGVPEDKVKLVPLGVDTDLFRPDGPALEIDTPKRVKLLYVGAAVTRKGLDVLLEAYVEEFGPQDDICLILKESVHSFIDSSEFRRDMGEMIASGKTAEIVYYSGDLGPDEMPNLYRAADALVLPYRGEGFGLPIVEAMACGVPPVVTRHGACLDFVTDDTGFFVDAREKRLGEKYIHGETTVDFPVLAEPDKACLRRILRSIYEDPHGAREIGRRARAAIESTWTWDRTAAAIADRLMDIPAPQSEQGRDWKSLPHGAGAAAGGRDWKSLPHGEGVGDGAGGGGEDEHKIRQMPTISLCMIVRDEEEFLPGCLDSVAGLVDEMVIVDTGSKDRTPQIARDRGSRLLHHTWENDFAAARQVSFDAATCDYILWLDADERLTSASHGAIRRALTCTDENSYFMKILNYQTLDGRLHFVHYLPRLFRRQKGLKIRRRLHEQIDVEYLSKDGQMGGIYDADIIHLGYVPEIVHARRKMDRNIGILKAMIEAEPTDGYAHMKLAGTYADLGLFSEALTWFEKAMPLVRDEESFAPMLYVRAAQVARCVGRLDDAFRYAERAVAIDPALPDARYILGQTLKDQGRYIKAIQEFEAATECPDSFSFATVDPTTRGFRAHDQLGGCYLTAGDPVRALEHYRRATDGNPSYGEAWHGLGLALLALQRPEEALSALERACRLLPEDPEAWANLGAAYGMQSNHEKAQQALEKALQLAPGRPDTLSNLGIAHMHQKRYDAAERALGEAARLDPANFDTLVRLSQLAQTLERHDEAIRWLERAVEHHPHNPASWLNLARLYLGLGHVDPARAALTIAMQLAPASQEALDLLEALPPTSPGGAPS